MSRQIKLVILFCLCFALQSLAFAEIPKPSADCFRTKSYCSKTTVLRDASDRRVIRVEIFVQIPKSTYVDYTELKDLFFRFSDWPSYAGNSDSIDFIESTPKVGPANTVRHLAHYKTKAPWPIKEAEVFDLLEYKDLAVEPGESYAVEFYQVRDFASRKGVKYNYGQLHLKSENAEKWQVYFYSDVVPAIDSLPNVAAPFILRPMEDILKGMFRM